MSTNLIKIANIRKYLTEFTQPSDQASTGGAMYRYRLSGNYEMLRVIRFLFAEVLSFRVWDQPMEKTNWVIPFIYKGAYRCYAAHEKFGFRVYIQQESEAMAEKLGKEIEAQLKKALRAAETVIEDYAKDALDKGEIIVENTFRQLYNPYDFFRKKTLVKEKSTKKKVTLTTKAPQNWSKAYNEKTYFEAATYFCFFSMLEHLCVLFLGFRNVLERENVAEFVAMKWKEKFKVVFNLSDPEFKKFYDHFIGLAKYQRNPAAHGNTNTVFDFYLDGARHKIPVFITDAHVSLPWRDQKTNFAMLESFLRLLKGHQLTRNIFAYIESGMNVSFSKSLFLENDQVAQMSKNELREYIEYMLRKYDDMANMDW